jgi:hypothetical protein
MYTKRLITLLALSLVISAYSRLTPASVMVTDQSTPSATPTTESTPTVAVPTQAFQPMSVIKIPAPSLENNLVGERTERDIYIYLPPSYGIPDSRFPVVY